MELPAKLSGSFTISCEVMKVSSFNHAPRLVTAHVYHIAPALFAVSEVWLLSLALYPYFLRPSPAVGCLFDNNMHPTNCLNVRYI